MKWFALFLIYIATMMIGVAHSEDDTTVPDNRQCDCLLQASVRPVVKTFGEWEWVGNIPRIPELADEWKPGHWPELLPNSCNEIGLCGWVVRLHGKACTRVRELPHFISGVWLY